MSRIDQLLRFAAEEPNDPFNIYAVAMEYVKVDPEKSIAFFNSLVKEHPDYIPTYYTYGKMLQARKDFAMAKKMFETGLDKATKLGDHKTVQELKNALSELEFEME